MTPRIPRRRLAPILLAGLFLSNVGVLSRGVPAEARSASVRDDGTILVDTVPFFPIGVYHVSWVGHRQGSDLWNDLDLIAQAGFNFVIPTLDPEHAPALDRAEALGLYVIPEIYWPSAESTIAALTVKPAVIGWGVADDFNLPVEGPEYPPRETSARSALVKGIDPTKLSYGSGGSAPVFPLARWGGTMDLIGAQSYQVSNCYLDCPGDDGALESNYLFFEHARTELPATPVIANLQSFKFDGGRFPTASESRNMLYAALVNGVRGIVYYAFYDDHGVLPEESPGLWSELQEQVAEVKALTPFLTDAVATPLQTGIDRLHASYWRRGSETLVVVLNTDMHASRNVSLAIPGAAGGLQARFPGRGVTGMTFSDGVLSGTILPAEVHVYVVGSGAEEPPQDPQCGHPLSTSAAITMADVLYVLRASVDLEPCDSCVCDVNASGTVTTRDVAVLLHATLDESIALRCPSCG
jgi:hypothetical protein